jgi:hypothetical protein
MAKTLAGMVVSSSDVDVVILNLDNAGQFEIVSQAPIKIQVGNRPEGYRIIHEQLQDQLQAAGVECACVKASAVSLGGTKKAHLEAAELRGVVLAAAALICEVRSVSKSATSRTFGDRGVDEYLKDNPFWDGLGLASLKKGMREAAFTAISQFS